MASLGSLQNADCSVLMKWCDEVFTAQHYPREDCCQCELKLHKGSEGVWSLNLSSVLLLFMFTFSVLSYLERMKFILMSSSSDVGLVQKNQRSSAKATAQQIGAC